MMTESDGLNLRIKELEKKVGVANNRSLLAILLVLLSTGLNVWWLSRPTTKIHLTDGSSVAELTPTELTLTSSLGTGRLTSVLIELERKGGQPLTGMGVGPRGDGFLSLAEKDGNLEMLTTEELSKLRKSLNK